MRSLYWSADDSKIVSSGMDGAIYDWGLKDLTVATSSAPGSHAGNSGGTSGFKRDGENILKSCSYTCAVSSPDGKSIYAVGSDKTIKEIVDSQIVREVDSDAVLTQIALSQSGKMMFLGSTTGRIRSMRFPLGSSSQGELDYQEHQGHSSVITKLRVSYDDQYLFSTSEDGCLYVFKISDKDSRAAAPREIVYADEVLSVSNCLADSSY